MALLKQVRAEFKSDLLSKEIARLQNIVDGIDEGLYWGVALSRPTYANDLVKEQAKLVKTGEPTRISAYGMPIASSRGNAQRRVRWTLEATQMQDHLATPLRLAVKQKDADKIGFDVGRYSVWIFEGKVYLAADAGLTPADVQALVNQEKNTRRLALAKAHALQAMSEQLERPRQREHITREVRIEVWQRDAGRCVECGAQESLEFDHIIPFAMGGGNTVRNLQLLCGNCNRRKGMTLG